MSELEQRIANLEAQLARTGLFPAQRMALERELRIAIATRDAQPGATPAGE